MTTTMNKQRKTTTTTTTTTVATIALALILAFSFVSVMANTPASVFAQKGNNNNEDDDNNNKNNNNNNNAKDNSNNNKNKDDNDEDSAVATNDDNEEESDDGNNNNEATDLGTSPAEEQAAADATGLQLSGTPSTTAQDSTAKSAAVSTAATANTDTLVPEYQRIIWTTTRTPSAELNMANNNIGTGNALDLDPGDQLVFHYGSGQVPTQAQIDALKQVDGITDNNIGFEFFSLAEIQQYAPVVASNGFGFIAYDLEAGASPSNETANPVASFTSAKAAADAAGIELQAVPSHLITANQGTQIAPLVSLYHIQSQGDQDNDSTCTAMKNFVVEREAALRGANSALNGKISYQVSFTAGNAPGKTAYQTITDCVAAVTPTAEDGVSVWWSGSVFDNTGTDGLKAAYTFIENGYSRNNPN